MTAPQAKLHLKHNFNLCVQWSTHRDVEVTCELRDRACSDPLNIRTHSEARIFGQREQRLIGILDEPEGQAQPLVLTHTLLVAGMDFEKALIAVYLCPAQKIGVTMKIPFQVPQRLH